MHKAQCHLHRESMRKRSANAPAVLNTAPKLYLELRETKEKKTVGDCPVKTKECTTPFLCMYVPYSNENDEDRQYGTTQQVGAVTLQKLLVVYA